MARTVRASVDESRARSGCAPRLRRRYLGHAPVAERLRAAHLLGLHLVVQVGRHDLAQHDGIMLVRGVDKLGWYSKHFGCVNPIENKWDGQCSINWRAPVISSA